MDNNKLMKEAISLYGKKGQSAVMQWGREKKLKFNHCSACETDTPFIAKACAVCGTYRGVEVGRK